MKWIRKSAVNDLSVVKLRYITHQSFVAGAFYGALGKELAVLFFREQFPLMDLHGQKTVGGLELGQAKGGSPVRLHLCWVNKESTYPLRCERASAFLWIITYYLAAFNSAAFAAASSTISTLLSWI